VPQVHPIIDACIECGFCESNCPTRAATVTPRQRIVLARRKKQIESGLSDVEGGSSAAADAFANRGGSSMTYDEAVTGSCAADGMCASKCPVGINTGEYVKAMRAVRCFVLSKLFTFRV
jgi:D-lactate dehydrogenase